MSLLAVVELIYSILNDTNIIFYLGIISALLAWGMYEITKWLNKKMIQIEEGVTYGEPLIDGNP